MVIIGYVRADFQYCRFLHGLVAVSGVVFVDENINLPALTYTPVNTPYSAMSATYVSDKVPLNKVSSSFVGGGIFSGCIVTLLVLVSDAAPGFSVGYSVSSVLLLFLGFFLPVELFRKVSNF